jgi:hypothetical protein
MSLSSHPLLFLSDLVVPPSEYPRLYTYKVEDTLIRASTKCCCLLVTSGVITERLIFNKSMIDGREEEAATLRENNRLINHMATPRYTSIQISGIVTKSFFFNSYKRSSSATPDCYRQPSPYRPPDSQNASSHAVLILGPILSLTQSLCNFTKFLCIRIPSTSPPPTQKHLHLFQWCKGRHRKKCMQRCNWAESP